MLTNNPYSASNSISQIYKRYKSNRIMKLFCIISFFAVLATTATAYSLSNEASGVTARRAFIRNTAATVAVGTNIAPAIADDADPYADYTVTESGLKYLVTKQGTGAIPSAGQVIKAHYTGWLDDFDSIRKFDSSRDRGRPFSFKVGAGQVIRGWDECFSTMAVGERRRLVIPPRMGYGDRGAGGVIPGGATLYFDVELLSIQ